MTPEDEKDLLKHVADEARPLPRARIGRPPTARRRKEVIDAVRTRGAKAIDRNWLLEQLMLVHADKSTRPSDKLRALDLMARLSGYTGKEETPEDERAAIADLMKDMEIETNL